MSRRLPPLGSIRAFEAAARHLSVTRAAAELHVTQAAVSHQVKALEDWLGTPLFQRVGRGLALTDAGRAYLPALGAALDLVADATARISVGDRRGVLTISTLASFAAKWLLPRLPRFQAAHPEIEVRLGTSVALVDFARQDVDLAVRMGRGSWPGLRSDLLMDEELAPVCNPALLDGPNPLRDPAGLARHMLLHDDDPDAPWELWLRAAGIEGVDWRRGTHFTDSALVIQAAVAGQGVALARGALVADDLAAGRLVRPFDLVLPHVISYWIVAPPDHFGRPKVAAFRDWLLAEAAGASASSASGGAAPEPVPGRGGTPGRPAR